MPETDQKYLLAYDPATGEALHCYYAQGSQEITDAYEAKGLAVMPSHQVNPEQHQVVDGQIVAKPPDPAASLLAAKKARYLRYETLSDEYLVLRGYKPGWMIKTIRAESLAQRLLAHERTTVEQKTAAQTVLDRITALEYWMMATVRGEFTRAVTELFAATNLAELAAVELDLETLNDSDPIVRLGTELYPLLDAAGAREMLGNAL